MQQKTIRQAKKIESVFNSAYWHLAQQDYTISEIRTKIERKTENVEWVEKVLAELIDRGYLKQDYDFAIRYSESSFSSEIGASAIKRKLMKKGIGEKDAAEAIEFVMNENNINQFDLAESRLKGRFMNFHSTTKEKVFSQMTTKGYTRSEIDHAIALHPEKSTLRTKLEVKSDKLDLEVELMKLYRKGKGKTVIRQELRKKLIKLDEFEDVLYRLEVAGDIDFFEACKEQLGKKKFNLGDGAGKSKAYAFLARKGFGSDEIKDAINPT